MRKILVNSVLLSALAIGVLTACSPKFNWRDYSSPDAPFRVMFPDKPASHTRSIDLDGMKVDMTMTAAQVDGATYAVGSAVAPDAVRAQAALAAMKTALVRNIGATVTSEKAGAVAATGGVVQKQSATLDVEASGVQNGAPMRLFAHFEARDKRFYQVIVIGRSSAIVPEQTEMFMKSFKAD